MGNNETEIKELVSDLKENLLYLNELGADEVEADLPDISSDMSASLRKPAPKAAERSDSYEALPPSEVEDLVSHIRESKTSVAKTPQDRVRRNVLGGTKLSDMAKTQSTRQKPREAKTVESRQNEKPVAPQIVNDTEATFETAPGSESLEDIRAEIGTDCTRCELCEKRTQVVNSVGSASADLMIVGEAPGADEDIKGEPFVGRAGKLLTKILEAIEFSREEVFIGNINRCRPPANRQPTLEESAMCKPYLLREIEAVKPKVIVVLGNTATKNLLDTKTGITKLRGTFAEKFGVKVMPTFHPAYLLRDPRKKREVWEDMKTVREYLDNI